MNKLTKRMIEHLNLTLQLEGSSLRYVEGRADSGLTAYSLTVVDKYINTENYVIPNVVRGFDEKVRDFFKGYGVEDLGYSNSIVTIFARG